MISPNEIWGKEQFIAHQLQRSWTVWAAEYIIAENFREVKKWEKWGVKYSVVGTILVEIDEISTLFCQNVTPNEAKNE